MIYKPIFLFLLVGLIACKKNELSPLEQLPPATQTGANTFGCLVNGKAWTPKGNSGVKPNFQLLLVPDAKGNIIDIRAYRLDNGSRTDLGIGSLVTSDGNLTYHYQNKNSINIGIINSMCNISVHDSLFRDGSITLTRYDLANGIISGTFKCNLYKPNCGDTIKITNGRFDAKL